MTSSPVRNRTSRPALSAASDDREAAGVLARHADNPSAYLALNSQTSHFWMADIDGLIAYRAAGRRHLIQFGGVFADPLDQDRLLRGFRAFAADAGRRIVAVQLLREDAERYCDHGFTVNQFGASYARSLDAFSLRGGAHMRLRNKIAKARRSGVTVSEIGIDRPMSAELDAELDSIDRHWLRGKGRLAKELTFMVGERGGPGAHGRRLFVATDADRRALGYITFSPVHGRHAGWLHDLSRRLPQAPPGTMETVILAAVERFRAQNAGYLHFGLTPFTGLADQHEVSRRSPAAALMVRLLAERGEKLYPAQDQLAYKKKWAPDVVQPEYVAFSHGVRLGAVWSLLRLTNVV
jgi:lysylphosphatidylglycerol synthetase-like protein (DUF2156 family)